MIDDEGHILPDPAEVVLDKSQQAELAKLINDPTPPTLIFEVDGDNLCNVLNHACRRRKN